MTIARWGYGIGAVLVASTGGTLAISPGLAIPKPDLSVTLRVGGASDHAGFEGLDDVVAGIVNPTLTVRQGAMVRLVIESGDDQRHQLVIPDLEVFSRPLEHAGDRTSVMFRAARHGRFEYFCSTPGHREAGGVGVLIVGEPAAASHGITGHWSWSGSRHGGARHE